MMLVCRDFSFPDGSGTEWRGICDGSFSQIALPAAASHDDLFTRMGRVKERMRGGSHSFDEVGEEQIGDL